VEERHAASSFAAGLVLIEEGLVEAAASAHLRRRQASGALASFLRDVRILHSDKIASKRELKLLLFEIFSCTLN
jgi:hypothetical protein